MVGREESPAKGRSGPSRGKTRRDETAAGRSSSASQKRLRRRTGSGEHVTAGKHGRGTGQAARQAKLS
ncbi:hypothetical protein BO83DRAFT_37282 [Aspergillus eucalypticola CBS 122712]|uniref:Uncharacterized protein n=1 Tax=Aspergillus eucalypticola (strain CBS 122712 / IBT 29274) TaxID=1448314 RepID=A0A317VE89_ASPEC|nr:uncharacterized protein BO83DRAFT_37282 [Aspergillus eucalypticola CBS 122712]PWY72683.1 hypothetical protein BO83DRAFT_37282 [Aspergillus eucalypticola CBS 122712]